MKQFILHKIAPRFKNFYFLSVFSLLVWITFFDGNDFITLMDNYLKLKKAERELQYYKDKIVEVNMYRSELYGSPAQLEKFAREQYLMKRQNEDIYLVEKEKQD